MKFGIVEGRAAVLRDDGLVDLSTIDSGVDPAGWRTGRLNELLALGPAAWQMAREAARAAEARPFDGTGVQRPVDPPDYVDFYSSLEHATNVGRIFRPDNPLPANWRHLPAGYHGRSSTVVVSGTPVRRPQGQRGRGDFGPTRELDFELELGFVTGEADGPVPIERAPELIFGVVLLNDWSARDIQRWEYQPLGPFLGKSFATSIGAWITPLDELPRVAPREQEPSPLPYLTWEDDFALDVDLSVEVDGEAITEVNAGGLYWTMAQQLAHATVNGATVRAGDLFASGTISGTDSYGCLLERGEGFLEDGQTVVMRGTGLSECRGTVVP